MTTDQQILEQLPDMGRGTDTVLAHMTLGEVVIPRALLDDPEVLEAVQSIFDAYGVNMAEFTVGDPANKINPETGYPEFFFKKIFRAVKKVAKKVAPVALPILGSLIPGVGPIAGAAIGGGLAGAVSGQGLKGIALGAGTSALGSALLGQAAGTTLAKATGNAALQGPTRGTGILGALTRNAPSLGGAVSTVSGGNSPVLSNALKIGGAIYEDSSTRKNNKKIQEQILAAQRQAQGYLNPYVTTGKQASGQLSQSLAAGFQPGDLTQDPGYQFQLQQGEEALKRSLAASGLGQSGAAVKAALGYSQGLADQTYNNAYQRYLEQNNQYLNAANLGQGSATNSAQLSASLGDAQAQILAANQESKNKRLAAILSGVQGIYA